MEANKPAGTYELVADVVDNVRNEKAKGYVTVVVREVPKVAFDNQVRSMDNETLEPIYSAGLVAHSDWP